MGIEAVRNHLRHWGREKDIRELETSTATVELAAKALGVEGARIAKSISLSDGKSGAFMVVVAGDARLDNKKFKATFHIKAKMLAPDEVLKLTGHSIGGVCPFGLPEHVPVYLDESMRRFFTVFPACGSSNSAIELTLEDLQVYSGSIAWVDVCSIP